MKALLVSAAAVGLLSAAPAFAQAGPTSTANANADAVIVTPISVINVEGSKLSFGTIASGDGGTITVLGDGSISSSDPNMLITGSAGDAAEFHVTGQANLAYTATVDSTVTLSNGSDPDMTATLVPDGVAATLDSLGVDDFSVGGVLTVPAGQGSGSYTGTFAVSVAYD